MGATSSGASAEAAHRYASALFDLATDTKAVEAVEADAKSFLAAVALSPDLAGALNSPLFAADDKANALAALATKMKVAPLTKNFIGLVAQNRRADLLPAMFNAFLEAAAKARGAVRADVTVPAPLSADQLAQLNGALERAFKTKVVIDTEVDPSLLGGLIVKVGSKMFDGSVRSKLNSLRTSLKGA